jgi:3D (Asp-Asp-Asp) domain-containing protein
MLISRLFILALLVFFLIPLNHAFAATTPVIRLQIIVSEPAQPTTILNKLRSWLGASTYIRPAVGTKYAIRSTGYAPSPYQTDSTPCLTAAGTRVRPGTVASNFLPMGTLLKIDNEIYIVEDRMNTRYYKAIDIFFPSTSSALEFGRQTIEIEIVGYGEPGQILPREEQSDEETNNNSGFLGRLRIRFNGLRWVTTRMLSTKVSSDVNRYDVNCFSQ